MNEVEKMTKDELWIYAVNYAARPDSLEERMIQRLLRDADGDVTLALILMTKTHWYEGWKGEFYRAYDSIAVRLGNGASSGPGIPMVNKFGSAATSKIRAWYPDSLGKDPDLEISWREVFEYIKAGRIRSIQLELGV